jgi:hypothetical protein
MKKFTTNTVLYIIYIYILLLLLLSTFLSHTVDAQLTTTTTSSTSSQQQQLAPSTLSFTADSYLVPTNITELHIGITRAGNVNGIVTTGIHCIDTYNTHNGYDYICPSGNDSIVTFTDGDMNTKNIGLIINQGYIHNGLRKFQITLDTSTYQSIALTGDPHISTVYINYCTLTGATSCLNLANSMLALSDIVSVNNTHNNTSNSTSVVIVTPPSGDIPVVVGNTNTLILPDSDGIDSSVVIGLAAGLGGGSKFFLEDLLSN